MKELGTWIITILVISIIVIIGIILNKKSVILNKFYPSKNKEKWDISRIQRRNDVILASVAISALILLSVYHWWNAQMYTSFLYPIITVSFIWLCCNIIFSFLQKDYENDVPKLHKVVIIPVYNEAPETVQAVLESISMQTVMPDVVCLIEDGSQPENICQTVFEQWANENLNIETMYKYIQNSGKRVAQAVAFKKYMDEADVFITIDSDTILDEHAIEYGLMPFIDAEVMSVAGLGVNYNDTSILEKATGIGFVSSFTNGRAAWGFWDSLAVSCGILAFYRKEVIAEHLDDYLTQTVFGMKANYGDDRMLTQYASLHGKTVYQESAKCYTLMPENLGHLTRQRTRWWKSFWWGTLWVLQHQSMKRPIWWLVLSQHISFVLYSFVFPLIMVVVPIMTREFPVAPLLYMVGLSYIRSLRTLAINHKDKSKLKQVLEYIFIMPISTILHIYICTCLQYYSLLTLKDVRSWGTRSVVEVTMHKNEEEDMMPLLESEAED